LRLLQDNLELENTGGRVSVYTLELIYLVKMPAQVDYDKITDFAEHLKQLFGANGYRHNGDNWHYCNIISINYQPDLPSEILDIYGFTMSLEIHKSY